MKIGIIFCAYNSADLLERSLTPWIKARSSGLGGHEFVIAVVSVPFEKFDEPRLDNTLGLLKVCRENSLIDRLIESDAPLKETEARGYALGYFIEQQCDVLFQVDSDESYAYADIEKILKFVESRPAIVCFKGSLKNYVFDAQTYLVQPFNPMRIHRVKAGDFVAHSFWDDNNVAYFRESTKELRRDIDFACQTIPRSISWVPHLTWLSDFRSKKKVEYQRARGWKCSFDWDEKTGLVWAAGQEQEVARD